MAAPSVEPVESVVINKPSANPPLDDNSPLHNEKKLPLSNIAGSLQNMDQTASESSHSGNTATTKDDSSSNEETESKVIDTKIESSTESATECSDIRINHTESQTLNDSSHPANELKLSVAKSDIARKDAEDSVPSTSEQKHTSSMTENCNVVSEDKEAPHILHGVEYDGTFPTITERYFTPYYAIDVREPRDDICIRVHSNRICMITLAPSHPIFEEKKIVKKVDFKVSDKLDRASNKVSGKGKHGAQPLQPDANICSIECEDGKIYLIKCCMTGKLIEVNDMLLDKPEMLLQEPHRGGYLAIALPNLKLLEEMKTKLLSQELYDMMVMAREVKQPDDAPDSDTADKTAATMEDNMETGNDQPQDVSLQTDQFENEPQNSSNAGSMIPEDTRKTRKRKNSEPASAGLDCSPETGKPAKIMKLPNTQDGSSKSKQQASASSSSSTSVQQIRNYQKGSEPNADLANTRKTRSMVKLIGQNQKVEEETANNLKRMRQESSLAQSDLEIKEEVEKTVQSAKQPPSSGMVQPTLDKQSIPNLTQSLNSANSVQSTDPVVNLNNTQQQGTSSQGSETVPLKVNRRGKRGGQRKKHKAQVPKDMAAALPRSVANSHKDKTQSTSVQNPKTETKPNSRSKRGVTTRSNEPPNVKDRLLALSGTMHEKQAAYLARCSKRFAQESNARQTTDTDSSQPLNNNEVVAQATPVANSSLNDLAQIAVERAMEGVKKAMEHLKKVQIIQQGGVKVQNQEQAAAANTNVSSTSSQGSSLDANPVPSSSQDAANHKKTKRGTRAGWQRKYGGPRRYGRYERYN